MKKHPLLLCLLVTGYIAQAGPPIADRLGIDLEAPPKESKGKKFLKKGANAVLKYIPGGEAVGDLFGLGGGLEDKVDRIEQRQATAIDQLRAIAQKARKTKEQVEAMYYFKKQSQQRAEDLARGLKQSKSKKLLGVILEDHLGFPINPAAYVPETDHTKELSKNLEMDLSLERGLIQRGNYLLGDTRAALAEHGLVYRDAHPFSKQYSQAEAYEKEVFKALQAKRKATLKLYQAEIKRLEKEIALLERAKDKQGLTVSDLMQIEQTIEMKRGVVRALHEKITAGIEKEMQLSEEQKEHLMQQKITTDAEALKDYLARARRKTHAKYGHLWRFW